ncbi:MAG: hypothetical protein ACYC2G_15290 [Gemmatimonadaceae bacterium]
MELRLSPEQAVELRDLITVALSELRSEIFHTDAVEFRERLHERERLLLGVQEQLGQRTTTPAS